MLDSSLHRDALHWLFSELTAELDGLATTVPDEPDCPEPIRGRSLYEAVQAVEAQYGGKLPSVWTGKSPASARRVWKDMLLAADCGEGADNPNQRNRKYEADCNILLQWAEAEIARRGVSDQQQARPAIAPKRRGRRKADYNTEQREAKFAADWVRSRQSKVRKIDFAKGIGMELKGFNLLLDRVAHRKRSSD